MSAKQLIESNASKQEQAAKDFTDSNQQVNEYTVIQAMHMFCSLKGTACVGEMCMAWQWTDERKKYGRCGLVKC